MPHKRKPMSKEQRKIRSLAMMGNKNQEKHRSKETKDKISIKLTNKPFTEEHKQNIRRARKYQIITAESNQKRSNTLMGHLYWGNGYIPSTKGLKWSEEHHRKFRESMLGHRGWSKDKPLSMTHRQNISIGMMGNIA